MCAKAINNFLDRSARCAYIDPVSGRRCVNTMPGHKIGHQDSSGELLSDGVFVPSQFSSAKFSDEIRMSLLQTIRSIESKRPSNYSGWRQRAVNCHKQNITALLRNIKIPVLVDASKSTPVRWAPALMFRNRFNFSNSNPNTTSIPSFCLGCLYGRPEYRLPCRHVLCETCLKDFAQSEEYPGYLTHQCCVFCAESASDSDKWPYTIMVRPNSAGIRVLSLDGGGVRGIVELTILERLEKQIGLGVPLGQFFDLIVGTSAGEDYSWIMCKISLLTPLGGIIALGVGVQGRSVEACIALFRTICTQGFDSMFSIRSYSLSLLIL